MDLRMFGVDEAGREAELRGGTVALEAELQRRIEAHMESMLGVRFLASEYVTGWQGGRVDSLGLDENSSPIVIEYKRGVSVGVMSQAVSYLGWLESARFEFEALVRDRLGAQAAASVDWRCPRVVVIAADFTRADRDAVGRLGVPVDMVRYQVFEGGLLLLQLVESVAGPRAKARGRRPKWSAPAVSAVAGSHEGEVQQAVSPVQVPAGLVDLYREVAEVLGERGVEVRATATYIAFRQIRNVASVVFRRRTGTILLYLRLCPDDVDLSEGFARDMRKVGHHGTGDLQVRIRSTADLERARPLINQAFAAA